MTGRIDHEATAEVLAIARICQSGYDRHAEAHGPDGSVTLGVFTFESPPEAGFTVKRDGKLFTVTVSPAEGERS
jgi:hypothetical protein